MAPASREVAGAKTADTSLVYGAETMTGRMELRYELMAEQVSVVFTLDGEFHDPQQPLLFANDLAAVRGDGAFETLLIRAGEPCLVQAHLDRLAHSARLLELPEPDITAWRRAIALAVTHWVSVCGDEAMLRLVYSRGRETGSPPTAYLTINPVPERITTARRNGIAVLLLDRGLSAAPSNAMPWLLAGAKTLSYAVNMAAVRYATNTGADDAIFMSTDGYVLEGPRSTVVIATKNPDNQTIFVTPPVTSPILRGTTQEALFHTARDKGYTCEYQLLRSEDLFAAQGVWLVSSVTLAARVHTLNGQSLPPAPMAAEITGLVDAAIMSDRSSPHLISSDPT